MPRAPKKCGNRTCENRVTGTQYCPTCKPLMAWGGGHGSTRQSRTERAEVLKLWPACYLRYAGCTVTSTEDDHVTPRHMGGTDDMNNRRGACHHCHRVKTMNEARAAKAARH